MKPTIVRTISRPEAETVSAVGELGVATLHEAQGRRGLMKPHLRPIFPTARVAGPAVTVLSHPGDNLMIHAAVELCRPGDVLVVALVSESTDGMFGELLACSLRAHGVVGLVIDAGVRDVAALTAMNFPVWSRAISAQGTVKETAGSINVEVVCAGAMVRPGDVIVGDLDGVVVVPREQAAEVGRLGQQRRAKEEQTRQRLLSGEVGLDIYGLRAKLAALGVEYRG
jgi:4-hydroxy-4-methyl-2-oxoglutarate aldolase